MEERKIEIKDVYLCGNCGRRMTREFKNPIPEKCPDCGAPIQKVVVLK